MRLTKQRSAILRILHSTNQHPTASWIHSELRKDIPHASLATVYRLLHVLAEEGVIGEIDLSDGAKRFDGQPGDHHHIVCAKCGLTVDVPELLSGGAYEVIARWTGFEVNGVRMSWQGLCPECHASDSDFKSEEFSLKEKANGK